MREVPPDTIHFERLCASQMILLLYSHGMSLIIQILVVPGYVIAYFNIAC